MLTIYGSASLNLPNSISVSARNNITFAYGIISQFFELDVNGGNFLVSHASAQENQLTSQEKK